MQLDVALLSILILTLAINLSCAKSPTPSVSPEVSPSLAAMKSPNATQTPNHFLVTPSTTAKAEIPPSTSPSPSLNTTSPLKSPVTPTATVPISPTVTPTPCKQSSKTAQLESERIREAITTQATTHSNGSADDSSYSSYLPSSYSRGGGQLSLVEKLAQTRNLFGLRKIEASDDARRLAALFSDRYLAWHRRHRQNRDTPRLIFLLRGTHPGVGDRLTGLISVLSYAVVTHRLLLIDWIEPFPLQDIFSTRRASLYAIQDDFEFTPSSSMTCTNGSCIDSMLNSTVHTVFFNATAPMKAAGFLRLLRKYGTREDIEYVRNVNDTMMITGPDGPTFALMLNSAFRLAPKFADFLERQTGTLLRGDFVAVHARLGKGVSEGGKRFIDIDEDCVAHMLAEAGVRKAYEGNITPPSLFLATDTPKFRGQFRAVAKSSGAKHVFMGIWETKHVARMDREDEHDRELFWLSMVDLILIGRARAVVGMGSRFANVGAFIGGNDAHIAIGLNGECGSWVIGAGKW